MDIFWNYTIRSETKTNRASCIHIFPGFVSATCNYFQLTFDWFTGLSLSILISLVLLLQHSIETRSKTVYGVVNHFTAINHCPKIYFPKIASCYPGLNP